MNALNSLLARAGGSAELKARLAVLRQTILAAIHDPAHNAVTMLLIIGAVAAMLLLILIVVVLVVMAVREWREPQELVPVSEVRRARPVVKRPPLVVALIWLIILGVLSVTLVVGWNYVASDKTCARCHITQEAFASRATDAHAKVACSSCHVSPGARGVFLAAVTGASNVRTQLTGAPKRASSDPHVRSAACLTCHKAITRGVVVADSIRMRHSDVLAVGYSCTDCHTVGHGANQTRDRTPSMAQCIQCHDGRKASSACSTCHSHDVGVATGRRARTTEIPKTPIVTDGCRGCHSMTSCIACHGIELPHSSEFVGGAHALKALQQPQVCVKCHSVTTFCNNCHQFRTTADGLPMNPHANSPEGFVAWHAKLGPTFNEDSASCYCHTKGGPRPPFCAKCHAPQPSR